MTQHSPGGAFSPSNFNMSDIYTSSTLTFAESPSFPASPALPSSIRLAGGDFDRAGSQSNKFSYSPVQEKPSFRQEIQLMTRPPLKEPGLDYNRSKVTHSQSSHLVVGGDDRPQVGKEVVVNIQPMAYSTPFTSHVAFTEPSLMVPSTVCSSVTLCSPPGNYQVNRSAGDYQVSRLAGDYQVSRSAAVTNSGFSNSIIIPNARSKIPNETLSPLSVDVTLPSSSAWHQSSPSSTTSRHQPPASFAQLQHNSYRPAEPSASAFTYNRFSKPLSHTHTPHLARGSLSAECHLSQKKLELTPAGSIASASPTFHGPGRNYRTPSQRHNLSEKSQPSDTRSSDTSCELGGKSPQTSSDTINTTVLHAPDITLQERKTTGLGRMALNHQPQKPRQAKSAYCWPFQSPTFANINPVQLGTVAHQDTSQDILKRAHVTGPQDAPMAFSVNNGGQSGVNTGSQSCVNTSSQSGVNTGGQSVVNTSSQSDVNTGGQSGGMNLKPKSTFPSGSKQTSQQNRLDEPVESRKTRAKVLEAKTKSHKGETFHENSSTDGMSRLNTINGKPNSVSTGLFNQDQPPSSKQDKQPDAKKNNKETNDKEDRRRTDQRPDEVSGNGLSDSFQNGTDKSKAVQNRDEHYPLMHKSVTPSNESLPKPEATRYGNGLTENSAQVDKTGEVVELKKKKPLGLSRLSQLSQHFAEIDELDRTTFSDTPKQEQKAQFSKSRSLDTDEVFYTEQEVKSPVSHLPVVSVDKEAAASVSSGLVQPARNTGKGSYTDAQAVNKTNQGDAVKPGREDNARASNTSRLPVSSKVRKSSSPRSSVATSSVGTVPHDGAGMASTVLKKKQKPAGGSVPVIVRKLGDLNVPEGEPCSLKCSFEGSPVPVVFWYFNGAMLQNSSELKQYFDGNTATLRFKDVIPDDTGRYQAVATNECGEVRTECIMTVQAPKPLKELPTFTVLLQDEEVMEGEPFTFKCEVSGNPKPKIAWFHNGSSLEEDLDHQLKYVSNKADQLKYVSNKAELHMPKVTLEDDGLFEVVARNVQGETKTVAHLSVKVRTEKGQQGQAPVFVLGLQDMSVAKGTRVELVATVKGSHPMEVCWVHDGRVVPINSPLYRLSHSADRYKLVIPKVTRSSTGPWSCEAYNEYGDAETSCQLSLTDVKDSMTASLQWQDTRKGSWLSPNKKPDDKSKPSQPSRLPEPSRKGLTKPVAQQSSDSKTNQEKSKPSRSGRMAKGPRFIQLGKSVTAEEGGTAKLLCEAVGEKQVNVTWLRDGQEVESGQRVKMSHDGGKFSLVISPVLETDAGRYTCVARDAVGETTGDINLVIRRLEAPSPEIHDFRSLLKSRPKLQKLQNAHENVLPKPVSPRQHDFRNVLNQKKSPVALKICKDLENQEKQIGDQLVLECQFTGESQASVKWLHDGDELQASDNVRISNEEHIAKMKVLHVQPQHSGKYQVNIASPAGKATSSCEVIVQDLQREEPQEETASEDQPLPVEAQEEGEVPSFTDCVHTERTDSLVEVEVLEPALNATFDASILSAGTLGEHYGSESQQSEDLPLPYIEDLRPSSVLIQVGENFSLNAYFTGAQPIIVKWFLGKKELLAGDRHKMDYSPASSALTVTDAQCEDSGKYRVVLTNEHGVDELSSSVTVQDKPDKPFGKPAASNVNGTSLTLAWSGPSYDGGSQVTHYKVEAVEENEKSKEPGWKTICAECQHTSYQVNDLKPKSSYRFRVRAVNKIGVSEPGTPTDPIKISKEGLTIDIEHASFTPRLVSIDPDRKFKDTYDVGEQIGRGKFGNVHVCTEKTSGQQFAAKFIRMKGQQREEFKLELDIMNLLHHPKLLLLFDAFETSRELILIMEHIQGGELFERIINDDYVLTERECVHFMRQICDGVAFMHSSNVLHLDLKPENILCVTPNSNEIKIIDFGLARIFDPSTKAKVLCGTPEFVAPEVINYDDIDFGTDMWSIGVICYILLSGLSPFLGDNEAETLANVTASEWDFDEEIFAEISQDAKDFILKLIQKSIRKRMSASMSLDHPWLSQDVKYMRAKRLTTEKHKRFMARRNWQKTGHAIRALGRMASLQKALSISRQSSSGSLSPRGSISPHGSLSQQLSSPFDTSSVSIPLVEDVSVSASVDSIHLNNSDFNDNNVKVKVDPGDTNKGSQSGSSSHGNRTSAQRN